MENYDRFFKSFSHPVRRRLIELAFQGKCHTLADFSDHFSLAPTSVRKHLRFLVRGGVFLTKTERGVAYYFFDPANLFVPWEKFSKKYRVA